MHLQQPSVLVVDDDRQLCELLTEFLADAGYAVYCARDGEDAWMQILRCPPDVVVSDIKMPKLDGVGLASRLASFGSTTPIILMSAGHHDWAGVSATFIRKPFDLDHLLAALEDVLHHPTTRRADASA